MQVIINISQKKKFKTKLNTGKQYRMTKLIITNLKNIDYTLLSSVK